MALITPNYRCPPVMWTKAALAATPAQLAQTLAEAKALAVAQQHPDDTVIGCDTVVDCDGAVFGKPSGEEDAVRMLHALSGREHKVHTGLCVVHGGKAYLATETTRVQFAPIEEAICLPMRAPRNCMTKPGLTPSRPCCAVVQRHCGMLLQYYGSAVHRLAQVLRPGRALWTAVPQRPGCCGVCAHSLCGPPHKHMMGEIKMANPILQLFEALRNMFTRDIGIDLGTANTLVYMKAAALSSASPALWRWGCPHRRTALVRCVDHEAKAIIGAAPNSILAACPLKDGVIADFDITAAMLQSFIRQACGSRSCGGRAVVICVPPSGVTEVERRAVRQAAAKAGARQVTVIEEPMAACIGAGLPTAEPVGSMIVDIGGGTAEVAVISLSGIVASCSVRCAAMRWIRALPALSSAKYNLLVGERTAEQIKLEIGSACPPDPTDTGRHGETTMEIKGRNLVDGLPKDILIRSEEVREAMNENLIRIVEAIKDTLECTRRSFPAISRPRHHAFGTAVPLLRGLDTRSRTKPALRYTLPKPAGLRCPRCLSAVLDHPILAGTRREGTGSYL